MTTTQQDVSKFYDNFSKKQKKIGISVRHRIIFKNLKKIGLRKDSNILEVGCGIGTVSQLMIKYANNGKFVGCDISQKSIDLARIYNPQKYSEFICTNMYDFSHDLKFDFIVFPDVLEHIPISEHSKLFENVSKVCSEDAKILINIPEPNSLNWFRKNKPDILQIIDQSLSMKDLLNNLDPYGFQIESITPYSIHTNVNNYLSIVFLRNSEIKDVYVKNKLTNFIFNLKARLKAL